MVIGRHLARQAVYPDLNRWRFVFKQIDTNPSRHGDQIGFGAGELSIIWMLRGQMLLP
jgi:hypothetical protein